MFKNHYTTIERGLEMKFLKMWFECRLKKRHRYDYFNHRCIICSQHVSNIYVDRQAEQA
jgi:hypothetical protein